MKIIQKTICKAVGHKIDMLQYADDKDQYLKKKYVHGMFCYRCMRCGEPVDGRAMLRKERLYSAY